jgi:hypothetical protein
MARTLLGWKCKLSLERALQWVVDWFRGYASGKGAERLTLGQIELYGKLGGEINGGD